MLKNARVKKQVKLVTPLAGTTSYLHTYSTRYNIGSEIAFPY
jgi:hypothetical protein